ncbi:hypothetical protein NPIL_75821 [Nephila pilipes]|uniref:Uncharacterized protein n=1 Tax=Nephila pilipes TaxID=299642 RepID=A0A8X6U6M5_NEPPI|nr:hypothetical protein NPIL_75821 [Nephila pilipes]
MRALGGLRPSQASAAFDLIGETSCKTFGASMIAVLQVLQPPNFYSFLFCVVGWQTLRACDADVLERRAQLFQASAAFDSLCGRP